VVRIVTREELIARCESQLARLDAAIAEWRRVGERNHAISDSDIAATESRRAELQRLLAQDRFVDVQKGVGAEIAFIQGDQETRLTQAAANAARARTTKRRAQSVAATVLAALDQSSVTVPDQLRRDLEAIASDRSEDTAAISTAFALLSREGGELVTERQRQLAEALKETDAPGDLESLLAREMETPDDAALARLEQRLATFAAVIGEAATAPFEERLERLSREPQAQRRALLIDSLELDLATAVARARQRSAFQYRLRLIAAELDALESEMGKAMAESVRARIDGTLEDLESLEDEARATLERAHREIAARARRQAVLTGLAGLGYEVSEGLETAWARDGRVVLRKAAQPEYGVEVGGGGNAARLQMRTVAFRDASTPPDTSRDRDAETIWCDQLTTLQSKLAASGGEIVIEKATPIGTTPLKVIADASHATDQQRRRREPPTQRTRDK
jgi:hypothetical protein